MLEQKFVDEVLYLFRNLKKINGFWFQKLPKWNELERYDERKEGIVSWNDYLRQENGERRK